MLRGEQRTLRRVLGREEQWKGKEGIERCVLDQASGGVQRPAWGCTVSMRLESLARRPSSAEVLERRATSDVCMHNIPSRASVHSLRIGILDSRIEVDAVESNVTESRAPDAKVHKYLYQKEEQRVHGPVCTAKRLGPCSLQRQREQWKCGVSGPNRACIVSNELPNPPLANFSPPSKLNTVVHYPRGSLKLTCPCHSDRRAHSSYETPILSLIHI